MGTGRIFQEGQEIIIDYQPESWADNSWTDDMSDEHLAEIGYTRPVLVEEGIGDELACKADAEYSVRRVLFRVS